MLSKSLHMCREVQKQEKNDDVETVDGPKKKRAKLESSLVTVKEVSS